MSIKHQQSRQASRVTGRSHECYTQIISIGKQQNVKLKYWWLFGSAGGCAHRLELIEKSVEPDG